MRNRLASPRARIALAAVVASLAVLLSLAAFGATEVRSGDRLSFALTGARVIAAPGRIFDRGVVVVRGGVVEAVGAEGKVPIPADARVFDLKGRVVHAAFVDPYVPADRLAGRKPRGPSDEEEPSEERTPSAPRRTRGPADHPLASVHADEHVVDSLTVIDRVSDTYRRLGYAVVAAAPQTGILRGRAAVVSLADGPISGRILEAEGPQVISLEPERFDFANFGRAGYPISRMGAFALVRQSFLDARWWGEAEAAYSRRPAGQARPRFVAANAALLPAAQAKETVVFEASDVLALLRAMRIAREMKLRALYVGAGDEFRLSDQIAAEKPDLVLRVDFPRPYKMDDDSEWLDVSLERLRAIDRAPSNPRWMRDAGVTFSLTTAGLDDPEDFPRRVGEAIARGLSREDALAAVTTIPARQLGLGDRLGEIAAGRIANLVVETGEPFTAGSRVTEIWIDGKRCEVPARKDRSGESSPHPGPLPAGGVWAAAREGARGDHARARTNSRDFRPPRLDRAGQGRDALRVGRRRSRFPPPRRGRVGGRPATRSLGPTQAALRAIQEPAEAGGEMNWLFKEEPTHYRFDDLTREKRTVWSGVKNPLAQKHLRSVKKGDRIFYYHTGDEKAVVGIAKALMDAYPDRKDKTGRAFVVDIAPVKKLSRPVTLAEIKSKVSFRDFPLVRISRLSVMPVSDREWKEIERMAGS
jgi:predicted RNA-binding protein with PUA-like domain/imidazolonepropionase-like amidohydrolase